MGSLISRFRKSKTTTEILEEIDKNVMHLEKFRRANQELRQKVIGKLILYSVIIYILGAFSLYFFFMPQEWSYRIYGLLPFLFFPFLVYLLKRGLHWFFVRKISQNEEELQRLKDQRKDILESVMEKETYKRAKEILEKFDPDVKQKLEEERKREEEMLQSRLDSTQSGLRRRHVGLRPQLSGSPQVVQRVPPSPINVSGHSSDEASSRNGQSGTSQTHGPLPRPVLPINKTTLDKIMDYMIGDGANQRYALICRHCSNHNGMALKEEFQYLAFRCAYCRFFNPARKQRPNAPQLPTSSPRQVGASSTLFKCDPNTDDVKLHTTAGTGIAAEISEIHDTSNLGSSTFPDQDATRRSTTADETQSDAGPPDATIQSGHS